MYMHWSLRNLVCLHIKLHDLLCCLTYAVHDSIWEGLFVTKASNILDPMVGEFTIWLNWLFLRNSNNNYIVSIQWVPVALNAIILPVNVFEIYISGYPECWIGMVFLDGFEILIWDSEVVSLLDGGEKWNKQLICCYLKFNLPSNHFSKCIGRF